MYGRWPDYFTQSPYFPPESRSGWWTAGPRTSASTSSRSTARGCPSFTSEDFAMHRVILGAGVVIMEGLTNLGALPRRRVEFAAPFYKIAGTEGAPARLRHRMTGSDAVLLRTDHLTRAYGSLLAVNRRRRHRPRGRAALDHRAQRRRQDHVLPARSPARWRRPRGASGSTARDITGLPQHEVCRLGIAKSYQITNIFPHLTVLENVRVAVQGYARSFNFWSRADAPHRRARPRRRDPRDRRARRQGRACSPRISRTARSATSRSPSRSPRSRCCCCSTSRPRA